MVEPRHGVITDDDLANQGVAAVALEALEHRYVEVMRELAAEPKLEPFKVEYEKLHRILNKSHEGEKRLLRKVTELREELNSHHTKIQTAVQLSQEDEQSITALREEIEKAWAMADTAHAREVESRELIQVLRQQVSELDSLVEQSAGLSMGQEVYLRDLITTKKEREDEHSVLSSKLSRLTAEQQDVRAQATKVQAKAATVRRELEEVTAAYQRLLIDYEAEQRERNGKEQSVRAYRATTGELSLNLEKKRQEIESLTIEERDLMREAEGLSEALQSVMRQLEERQVRFKDEAERLVAVEQHNMNLKKEIPKRAALLKDREGQLAKLEKPLSVAEKAARAQQDILSALVKQRDAAIEATNKDSVELDELVAALAAQEKEIAVVEEDLRRALQQKARTTAENSVKENLHVEREGQLVLEKGKRHRREQELASILVENESMRKKLFELEQLQVKEMGNAQNVMLEYQKTLDHIRQKRGESKQLRDLLAVHEKKLKTQQELLDRVKADRNRTESQLRETEMDWRQLSERHTSKREDIEMMKNELIAKEAMLCQLHSVNKQLQCDTSNTEQRAGHLRDDCTHAGNRLTALQAEAHQLHQVIANCDTEKLKQQMRLAALTNERNVIATQLIRRSDELRVLHDKIQLQQSTLDKGAVDYQRRVEEVMAARDALSELRLKFRVYMVRLRYLEQLKKKELVGDRALARERARVRALVEELENPMNVHRWRRLEGRSPELLDAIAKVQMLQKAHIAKCDECDERTKRIAEKQAEYERIRQRLARLPGPEAAEDLALFKENLEKRHEQITDMAAELTEVELTADVLGEEVRVLNAELADVKRKFFNAKTKYDALTREQRALRKTWGESAAVAKLALTSRSAPDIIGGGGVAAAASPVTEQRTLSQNGWQSQSLRPTGTGPFERQRRMRREKELLHVLSTSAPAPNFPLRKPPHQRQFVGGGFALTR